jgi:hypothetical protein
VYSPDRVVFRLPDVGLLRLRAGTSRAALHITSHFARERRARRNSLKNRSDNCWNAACFIERIR